jgi:hypothetical protein
LDTNSCNHQFYHHRRRRREQQQLEREAAAANEDYDLRLMLSSSQQCFLCVDDKG